MSNVGVSDRVTEEFEIGLLQERKKKVIIRGFTVDDLSNILVKDLQIGILKKPSNLY